jgi:single-strand DNA-binding protein
MTLTNSCRFLGRLGQEPDLQYTPSGTAIVKTSLAVKERKKDGEEWVDSTTWVNITAFGRQAETMAQIANKGDLIQIDAQYQTSTYEVEGETRYRHDFIVREWNLAARKQGTARVEEEVEDEVAADEDEHLPF